MRGRYLSARTGATMHHVISLRFDLYQQYSILSGSERSAEDYAAILWDNRRKIQPPSVHGRVHDAAIPAERPARGIGETVRPPGGARIFAAGGVLRLASMHGPDICPDFTLISHSFPPMTRIARQNRPRVSTHPASRGGICLGPDGNRRGIFRPARRAALFFHIMRSQCFGSQVSRARSP